MINKNTCSITECDKPYYAKSLCKNHYWKKLYYDDRPKALKKLKDNRNRRKRVVIRFYSNGTMKCACCGESIFEFLSIEHDEGNGNIHRKLVGYGNSFYLWLINNDFPDGFSVLCFNCNLGKSVNGGICPHRNGNS